VSAVAAVAGLAIENECLHTQARGHLIETKASRAGTVAAAGTERRRLEGNLHDGAQQAMLNLMLTLRLAKVTVGATSDNGEQPALRNSERGDRRV
jgi:signal transduction histidine kinase